jgi:hypothetical protein
LRFSSLRGMILLFFVVVLLLFCFEICHLNVFLLTT